MTGPGPAGAESVGPELLTILPGWMARRRWYTGKGRVPDLAITSSYRFTTPERGVDLLTVMAADRSAGDDVPILYHVPLTVRSSPVPDLEPALVGTVGHRRLGTCWVYDACHDPAYTSALLDAVLGERASPRPGDAGASARGRRSGSLREVVVRSCAVLTGEQSNTSIIYDAAAAGAPVHVIAKVFRMLQPGLNPDVVVQAAISAAGSARVPAALGALEGTWTDASGGRAAGHLAFVQEFLPGSRDAWRVALDAARRATGFTGPARALGAATAEVHGVLARALGTATATAEVRARLRQQWRARQEAAIEADPSLAASAAGAEAVFDRAVQAAWPPLQRVHGDYHLGQVLEAPGRGWVLLDFEGEPLRPLSERSEPDLALRDVAGMLRSFDYVAGTLARERAGDTAARAQAQAPAPPGADPHPIDAAHAWSLAAQDAFLDGYATAAPDPRQDRDTGALLAALTLDKALYEVVYETRNRPDWRSLPSAAVVALAGAGGARPTGAPGAPPAPVSPRPPSHPLGPPR